MDRLERARVLGAYTAQVRGRVPRWPPTGAVVELDGPLVRTHCGTHGTVGHGPLTDIPRAGIAELVRRGLDAFAARGEPVRWKVHGDDPGALAAELTAAGFKAGPERSLLVAEFARLEPLTALERGRAPRAGVHSLNSGGSGSPWWEAARALAEAAGPHAEPHAEPLADFEADGGPVWKERDAAVLLEDGRVIAAGWAEVPRGTDFLVIGGVTGPHAQFPRAWRELVTPPEHYHRSLHRPVPYCVAEAAGELRAALLAAGFAELTTVRTHHWAPPTVPARSRPVALLDPRCEDRLWDRVEREYGFQPRIERFRAFEGPAAGATWRLDCALADELERIVRPALQAVTRPGERLAWLDWNHTCYDFDPHRVGGPGEPDWPGEAYPNGDYYLFLDHDLRFGTFGHPWEETLTVFGADLLAAVGGGLTALLGEPLRRTG
ncbi:DUF2716 domain-containing protein [Streptomyces sp. NPDC056491]|uniref:DUF2716 domain-containing protein n=1 Tax=Streptomyces sp. NPDC056491 TaxID=3345837 RepID=UPI0036B437C2